MSTIMSAQSALELSAKAHESVNEYYKKLFIDRWGEGLETKIKSACEVSKTSTVFSWTYFCSSDKAFALSEAVKSLLSEAGYKDIKVTQGYDDSFAVYFSWDLEEDK